MTVTRRSGMSSAVKGRRIIVTVLYAFCLTLIVEGRPQLYSCSLQIKNGSTSFEYTCTHDFEISEDGARIPSSGIALYLTSDPGCACEEVEIPSNASRGWAAVVKYNSYDKDCSINEKVNNVQEARYLLALLVSSSDCRHGGNKSQGNFDTSTIPIITAGAQLGRDLLKFSRPTSEIEYAAVVQVEAVYVDFALLWTVFGVTVAITITSTICCFCIFFVFRGLAYKFRRQGLSRWSLRKLPQRKYVKNKEAYETCSICLEEFENAELIRVLPCNHIYHSKCVDEWLMKWNRVCPVCKRVILRNERSSNEVEVEETDSALPEPASSGAAADNLSDTDTVESIPLLITVHESTERRTQRYGSVAENSIERSSTSPHLLEPFAAMQNTAPTQQSEESVDVYDNLPRAESDRSDAV